MNNHIITTGQKKLFPAILFIAILALTPHEAKAEEKQMKLLAVSQDPDNPEGVTADLYLETEPGSGRIFMDTFPLTKLDTQMSTRFANSIACDFVEEPCTGTDFFYTIRSNSVIVGGPSAGGALSVLSVAAIEDLEISEDMAITGTINSGGLIGPVGGLKKKIEAASEAGLAKVLIPQGERYVNVDNETIDLYSYGQELKVEVIEVATIDDALYEFTGRRLREPAGEITIAEKYQSTMENIAKELCSRADMLKKQAAEAELNVTEEIINLSVRADKALEEGLHYTAASYCFGANIQYSYLSLLDEDPEDDELKDMVAGYQRRILQLKKDFTGVRFESLSDLEAYEVVMERLIEAEDHLKDAVESLRENNTRDAIYSLSYGMERYNSAVSWSSFFGQESGEIELSEEDIQESCISKLAEAEERYQYLQLYMPMRLQETARELELAYEDKRQGRYVLCLFKASKAKADANVVLGAMGITEGQLQDYIDNKIWLAGQEIARQQEKGHFPVLGYSYYEYAGSLQESDPYSALVYAEYALELSNLEMYFKSQRPGFSIDYGFIYAFTLGSLFGGLLALFLVGTYMKKKHIQIKVRRKR